jgi:hypothetical protein
MTNVMRWTTASSVRQPPGFIARAVALLRPAADAHVLDTTQPNIEGAVAAAIAQVERTRP